MDQILLWSIVVAVVCWSYQSGKQLGSRKGFNAGRNSRRRDRR